MNGEAEKCGICGSVMAKLRNHTTKKNLPVFVCTNVKVNQRIPCDGFAFRISEKNHP